MSPNAEAISRQCTEHWDKQKCLEDKRRDVQPLIPVFLNPLLFPHTPVSSFHAPASPSPIEWEPPVHTTYNLVSLHQYKSLRIQIYVSRLTLLVFRSFLALNRISSENLNTNGMVVHGRDSKKTNFPCLQILDKMTLASPDTQTYSTFSMLFISPSIIESYFTLL